MTWATAWSVGTDDFPWGCGAVFRAVLIGLAIVVGVVFIVLAYPYIRSSIGTHPNPPAWLLVLAGAAVLLAVAAYLGSRGR